MMISELFRKSIGETMIPFKIVYTDGRHEIFKFHNHTEAWAFCRLEGDHVADFYEYSPEVKCDCGIIEDSKDEDSD